MFWGHTPEAWAAIGTWVYVGLTLLLAVAAGLAAFFTYRQLRETRQTRIDSVRPLVHIQNASPQRMIGGDFAFGVRVSNVGLGPALQVRICGWPRLLDSDRVGSREWHLQLDVTKSRIELEDPPFAVRLGALGAGERVDVMMPWIREVDGADVLTQETATKVVLFYMAYYQDVHEQEFPRKTPSSGTTSELSRWSRSTSALWPAPCCHSPGPNPVRIEAKHHPA